MSNAKPNRLDTQLLTDLQRYFARQPAQHYSTEQLLDYLTSLHAAPWATFADGKPITARHLARLLQPYGIVSKTIRVSATATPKCYRVADFKDAFAKLVADNVADNVVDKIDVADNVLDVAANVAANVADKKELVADNVLDATRNQIYRLGESLNRGYEATGNPFSHASPSEIQQWRDLAYQLRQAAESIDSFTATTRPTLTLIQGGASTVAATVADKQVVAATVAATVADNPDGIADNLAAPVPARPQPKSWPPPKGWAWNHQTGDYEPPKPTVQTEPMDQVLIRQTLHVDPSLHYIPGYGLVAVEPNLSA